MNFGTYQQGPKPTEVILGVVLVVLWMFPIILITALIVALPTMWLWNWLMPDLFGLRTIDFWQALGINILSGILFKSSSSSSKSD